MTIKRRLDPKLCLISLFAGTLYGCAAAYMPTEIGATTPLDEIGFKERAVSQSQDRVRVSVAVLTAKESQAAFGLPLGNNGIQPVWIEIENGEDAAYTFLPIDVDQDYFAPYELAWLYRKSNEDEDIRVVGEHFTSRQVPFNIGARQTVSGFVYTNTDLGAKSVSVDLIGDRQSKRFEFVVVVPGLRVDVLEKNWDEILASKSFTEVDDEGLRDALEKLPCCVLGGDRKTDGDPINIVVIGGAEDLSVFFPLIKQGWDVTETVHRDAVWATIKSSVLRHEYRNSPISPLYVFERSQDIGLQKARATVDERNHLRLWLSPYLYRGKGVWVGQISRDIGVKFTRRTVVTHKIDPDVDEARDYLTQDLIRSGYLAKLGYVKGIGRVTPSAPRYNFTDDPYWSDGMRAVYLISDTAVPESEIGFWDWERPGHDTAGN